jgi:hypothetical protein
MTYYDVTFDWGVYVLLCVLVKTAAVCVCLFCSLAVQNDVCVVVNVVEFLSSAQSSWHGALYTSLAIFYKVY